MGKQKDDGIMWTDETWNPIRGCTRKSEGCRNCYAESLAGRFSDPGQPFHGLAIRTKDGGRWTGRIIETSKMRDPLRWTKPRMVFVNSVSDVFHENLPDNVRDEIYAVMALAKTHTFQVLTKRADIMKRYLSDPATQERISIKMDEIAPARWHDRELESWPLPNLWQGVSVENQGAADERIPDLFASPAAVRFLSCEPLLGPVDLTNIDPSGIQRAMAAHGWSAIWEDNAIGRPCLDWVIVGGESGHGARPMHPDWVRSLRDQCARAGIPFLFKQWGEWIAVYDRDSDDPDWRNCPQSDHPSKRYLNLAGGFGFHGDRVVFVERVGKKAAGRMLDGSEHSGFPEMHRG